jgi:enoyl-CoA hydratase/carnithine racemase
MSVVIDRPEVRNAIDAETAGMLAAVIGEFGREDRARVLVVTGAGTEAFCSGMDLRDLEGLLARTGLGPLGFATLEPGKPRIAAIEGWCVGGGLELACWCDVRVAGRGARFGALNRRVGVPWVDGGTQRLPRIVGLGNALYLLESGQVIDADVAVRMGLLQEVVEEGASFDRAMELAAIIASHPPASLLADRASVAESFDVPLGEGLRREGDRGRDAAGPEMEEGVRRYLMERERPGG